MCCVWSLSLFFFLSVCCQGRHPFLWSAFSNALALARSSSRARSVSSLRPCPLALPPLLSLLGPLSLALPLAFSGFIPPLLSLFVSLTHTFLYEDVQKSFYWISYIKSCGTSRCCVHDVVYYIVYTEYEGAEADSDRIRSELDCHCWGRILNHFVFHVAVYHLLCTICVYSFLLYCVYSFCRSRRRWSRFWTTQISAGLILLEMMYIKLFRLSCCNVYSIVCYIV